MNIYRISAVLTACLGFSSACAAATLSIEPIGGIWSSSKPAVAGIGTNQLNWGEPQFTRQSGYHFEAQGPFEVESETPFVIGTFTHQNFPVRGQILESAQLKVSFRIAGLADPIASTFSFVHDETLNDQDTCPNGLDNRVGINVGGCADRVTVALNEGQSQRFEIDGASYVLDVLGFQYDGVPLGAFWTQENQENQAQLIARFTTETPPAAPNPPGGNPPVSTVPVPASGLLLATLLLVGAGLQARSRHSRVKLKNG